MSKTSVQFQSMSSVSSGKYARIGIVHQCLSQYSIHTIVSNFTMVLPDFPIPLVRPLATETALASPLQSARPGEEQRLGPVLRVMEFVAHVRTMQALCTT